jgi:hypothetical protein
MPRISGDCTHGQAGGTAPGDCRRAELDSFPMKYFAMLMLVPLSLVPNALGAERPLPPPGMPPSAPQEPKEHKHRVEGTDRTITWRRWQEMPGADYRVRTGDRYLGHSKWEHYLVFEQSPGSVKRIRFSLIRLASQPCADVETSPGSRYAIVKITNGVMTARKGLWSWTAQETDGR